MRFEGAQKKNNTRKRFMNEEFLHYYLGLNSQQIFIFYEAYWCAILWELFGFINLSRNLNYTGSGQCDVNLFLKICENGFSKECIWKAKMWSSKRNATIKFRYVNCIRLQIDGKCIWGQPGSPEKQGSTTVR